MRKDGKITPIPTVDECGKGGETDYFNQKVAFI